MARSGKWRSSDSALMGNDCNDYNAIVDDMPTEEIMGSITIRNIDDQLKARLRVVAATNGRSMEEEVRVILKTALSTDTDSGVSLLEAIRAKVAPFGGIELEIPERTPIPDPPDLQT